MKILPRHNGVGWRPLDGVNGCVFHYFNFIRRAERIRPGVGLRQTNGGLKKLLKHESLWRFVFNSKKYSVSRNNAYGVIPRKAQPLTETNEFSSLATAADMPPRCVGLSWPVWEKSSKHHHYVQSSVFVKRRSVFSHFEFVNVTYLKLFKFVNIFLEYVLKQF